MSRRLLAMMIAPIIVAIAGPGCIRLPLTQGQRWQGAGPTRIADPSQRFQFRGFSLLAPSGGRWKLMPPMSSAPDSPYMVAAFGRDPDAAALQSGHTILAAIYTWDLGTRRFASPEEFLEGMKAMARVVDGADDGRHRVLRVRSSLDPAFGPNCISYEYALEDTGVPGQAGAPFTLEIRGRRCLHPRWPRYVVDVAYSQRYRTGLQAASVDPEVAPFLGSLSFTDDRPLCVTTIPVGDGPQGVVFASDSFWVAYGEEGVVRIDPGSNRVVAQIQVGKDPIGIAPGWDSVWVANREGASVSRIDVRTNQLVATIPIGAKPMGIAAGAGAVWAASPSTSEIVRIDPASNQVVARIAVEGEPTMVTSAGDVVWTSLFRDAKVARIDPRTNAVTAKTEVCDGPIQLAAGVGSVWVTCEHDGNVARVDSQTARRTALIPVGARVSGILFADDALWVTRFDEASISRIDPRTNEAVGRPIPVGHRPIMIAPGDAKALWVTNAGSGTVSRVEF